MDVSLNWIAIVVVAIVTWMGGALWFGPIFGKLWMRINFWEKKLSDAENAKLMKGMWKLMLSEFVVTFLMIMTLDFLIKMLPFSGVHTAFLAWIGFVFPMCVSNIIWGSDERRWMFAKIALTSGYRLIALLLSGYVLGIWL